MDPKSNESRGRASEVAPVYPTTLNLQKRAVALSSCMQTIVELIHWVAAGFHAVAFSHFGKGR